MTEAGAGPADARGAPSSRRWQLLRAFSIFIAAYALLHKVFLPLLLSFTTVAQGRYAPYARIDLWFWHPLAFAIVLNRREANDRLLSLLSGIAVALGALELMLVARGHYPGWLGLSRLLSSLPVAGLAIVLMSQPMPGRSLPAAWAGAALLGSLAALLWWAGLMNPRVAPAVAQTPRPAPASAPTVDASTATATAPACGSSQIAGAASAPPAQLIEIDSCGFRPALAQHARGRLSFENKTAGSVNLHLLTSRAGRRRMRFNLLLLPHTRMQSPALELADDEAGMIYSDTSSGAGIVGILSPRPRLRWNFSRTPLMLEPAP